MHPAWFHVTLLTLTVPAALTEANGLKDIVVSTQQGRVQGTTRTVKDPPAAARPVYSFFGVPYGRSPDYMFRFHYPTDPWKWGDAVLDLTNENVPFCQQDRNLLKSFLKNTWYRFVTDEDHPMSENCLTLNIFTPKLANVGKSNKGLPVLLYIHGGSFQFSATTNKMWMLPAFEDVVLVTVNYRLGVFGFLGLADEWAPSNTAFVDQVKALEWIRDNIASFGGNPNLVTIAGYSAGGFAASAHTFSPLSNGLFHRVVAMSGVATLPNLWANNHQAEKTLQVAKDADCLFYANEYTITCLRNHLTSSQLINASKNIKFLPEVDGTFITHPIDELLEKNAFSRVPILLGSVAGEFDFVLSRKLVKSYREDFATLASAKKLIASDLSSHYPHISDALKTSIFETYLPHRDQDRVNLMKGVVDYYSDAWFHSQAYKVAEHFNDAGVDVFMYKFAFTPSFYGKTELFPRPHEFKRADHSDDVLYYFGFPFLSALDEKMKFTEQEKRLSRDLMAMLARFAKNGNPSDGAKVVWEKFPSRTIINGSFVTDAFGQDKRKTLWRTISKSTKEGSCNGSTTPCR